MNRQEELLALEKEQFLINEKAGQIRKRIREINAEIWQENHGIKLGDKFSYINKGLRVEAVLKAFQYTGNTIFNVVINPINLDGSVSKVQRNLYSSQLQTIKKI